MTFRGARKRDRSGRRPRVLHVALLVLLVGLGSLPADLRAQTSTSGAIRGRILDLLGLPVAGADISITNLAQAQQVSVRSSPTGDFVAIALAPAEYDIDLRSSFRPPLHLGRVLVEVGATTRLEATAVPTGSNTDLTVTAESSRDIDEPSVSTAVGFSSREISRLPVDGRRWQALTLLTPLANPGADSDTLGLLSFRGLAPTQNASRIDGGDDDQSFNAAPHGSGTDSDPETEDESQGSTGGGFSAGSGAGRRPGAEYTFSQAAVREFRVIGQNSSALFGHAAGGVVATVSKSGSDTLHGSGFYLLRESAWAATNPFAIATRYGNGLVTTSIVKPEDHRQQFGGTIGGPILPGRVFYFYALDAQRRSFPAISSPENPAFYQLSATQTALLGNRGVTSRKINAALNYLDGLTGSVPRRADQTVNFFKLEDQITPRHLLSLQYNRARFSSPAGIRSAPVVSRGVRSFGSQNINADSALGRWIYSPNSAFTSEVRLGYSRDLHYDQAQTPLPEEPSVANDGLSPEIDLGPQGFSFGTPASLGKRAAPDEHRYQAAAIATLEHSRHLIQLGFDYSYVHDFTDSLTNMDGTFHYDSGTTGGHAGGLVDWITDYTFNVNTYPNGGCPSINSPIHNFCFRSFSQTFGQQTASFSTQEFAGFFRIDGGHGRRSRSPSASATSTSFFLFLNIPIQHSTPCSHRAGPPASFPKIEIIWALEPQSLGSHSARAAAPFISRTGCTSVASRVPPSAPPWSTPRPQALPSASASCQAPSPIARRSRTRALAIPAPTPLLLPLVSPPPPPSSSSTGDFVCRCSSRAASGSSAASVTSRRSLPATCSVSTGNCPTLSTST